MLRNIFCFVILGMHQVSNRMIKPNEIGNTIAISDCVHRMAKISSRQKLAVWYSIEENDIISELLKKMTMPVVLNAAESSKERGLETRTPSDFVIVLNRSHIARVLNETLWTAETRFLVLVKNFKNMVNDFQYFWRSKVVNVFEILEREEDIAIYSFLPYDKRNCGVGEPAVVDIYSSTKGNFINSGEAFKESVRIKNMNGCPINVTIVDVKPNVIFEDECQCNGTTHIQGIEGNLMIEVAKKLNFNASFLIALDGIGWGWIRPSPHGAVGEVFTGRSDFAIGLLAPTIERYESLDLSLPYNGEECITYGVPKGAGASTPNWITILVFEFSLVSWVLIFFSFIFVFTLFQGINKFSPVKWFSGKTDVILYMFSSCLGLPVRVPNYLSLRLSMTCWITFTFIITVAYRSSMGSKLTVPNRDPDINTFQELLQSKLQLTGYNNMLRLLEYSDNEPNIQKMVARFKVTNFDIDFAVDRIAQERKIAYVRHTSTFLYYALINPKAKGHIHVIKDCIMLYHPMIVTKKHSPFSYRLNQIISRLMESGITKKWRSQFIYNIPPPSKPFLKLSNDHMYGVFCILCFGYFLAFIAFLYENIQYYFKRN